MKYMGSKRAMLGSGLDQILKRNIEGAARFVDLFTGSGSVACYVAENFALPVIATDLQEYATILARSIVCRDKNLCFHEWAPQWIADSVLLAEHSDEAILAAELQGKLNARTLPRQAAQARDLCSHSKSDFVRAYGGWYFSPWQALLLDSLRQTVAPGSDWEDVAIAAIIQAASKCAAAPGHTAQPFKPDTGAAPFLLESWRKDIVSHITHCSEDISKRHAQVKGSAVTQDANHAVLSLQPGDLAFVDPPYSSVHYSRFYHVLESLARGRVGPVSGAGRYPASEERPSSAYSIPTKAEDAVRDLLHKISRTGASAIITFPAAEASNRLSGERIKEIAINDFKIVDDRFLSRFSTLGGDQKHRNARKDTEEMVLTLHPR